MGKVVIDMSMSLDGFVTGPGDGPRFPLGERGARRLFDLYFSGQHSFEGTVFTPNTANRPVLAEIFANVGAMLTVTTHSTSPMARAVRIPSTQFRS